MCRKTGACLLSASFSFLFLMFDIAVAQPTSPPMEIHSKHWLFGYPLGAPATNDLIIRDIYALSSNDTRKFADWVAYRLTPHEIVGTLDLKRKWRADPWLDDAETLEPSSPNDYQGASDIGYDRGHQAPLASFKGSRHASQSNFLSNITPQQADLNQGPWRVLEGRIRVIVKQGKTLWVMTGPLYERDMPQLPNANETHTVPSGYWKIVAMHDGATLRVAAFIMEQDTARDSPLQDHAIRVRAVQDRTGLDFFWELPDDVETELENRQDAVWLIGGP